MPAVFVDVTQGDEEKLKAKKKKTPFTLPLTVNDLDIVYIPLSDCKHGWLYKIMSRNLTRGVYRKDRKGFIGIRRKLAWIIHGTTG